MQREKDIGKITYMLKNVEDKINCNITSAMKKRATPKR